MDERAQSGRREILPGTVKYHGGPHRYDENGRCFCGALDHPAADEVELMKLSSLQDMIGDHMDREFRDLVIPTVKPDSVEDPIKMIIDYATSIRRDDDLHQMLGSVLLALAYKGLDRMTSWYVPRGKIMRIEGVGIRMHPSTAMVIEHNGTPLWTRHMVGVVEADRDRRRHG